MKKRSAEIKKRLAKIKNHLQWDLNHVPASYVALRANGCLHLRLLGTPVDERWALQACRNKLCEPQRHSFHFE